MATRGTVHSPWQPAGLDQPRRAARHRHYMVVPGETDTQLLTTMVDRFDRQADALGLAAGSAQLGLTRRTRWSPWPRSWRRRASSQKNLGPVARVILNRLATRHAPADGLHRPLPEGRDGGPVTRADLQLHTPYNTYLTRASPRRPSASRP